MEDLCLDIKGKTYYFAQPYLFFTINPLLV